MRHPISNTQDGAAAASALTSQQSVSNGDSGSAEKPYLSSVYFDPNNLCSTTKVKALYNYEPKRTDELNLVKDCVVTNVVKHDKDWWRGDCGNKRQYW